MSPKKYKYHLKWRKFRIEVTDYLVKKKEVLHLEHVKASFEDAKNDFYDHSQTYISNFIDLNYTNQWGIENDFQPNSEEFNHLLERYYDKVMVYADDVVRILERKSLGKNKKSISWINEELRILKTRIIKGPDYFVFVKIRDLICQLHQYLKNHLSAQRNNLKACIRKISVLHAPFDIRKHIRAIVSFLYKCDFSSDEEDSPVWFKTGKLFFSSYNFEKSCLIKIKFSRNSMPSLNQRIIT